MSKMKRENHQIILLQETHLSLFCVHLPPQSDQSIMKKVLEPISSESQGTEICAGDFNMVINGKLDTSNNKRNVSPLTKLLRKGLDEVGLLDVWRDLHPSDKYYTFYSAPHAVFSRIDYIFMFQNDRHRILNCDIGTRDISDHSPIYLVLHLDSRPKKTI